MAQEDAPPPSPARAPQLHFRAQKHRPGHFGADDYETGEGAPWTLSAHLPGGNQVGCAQVEVRAREVHVRWIEVDQAWRRRGVGRALIGELQRRFDRGLDTAGFTEEGEALWRALELA